MRNKRVNNYRKNKKEDKFVFLQFVDEVTKNGLALTHLPRFLFLCALFVMFIFFNHNADRHVVDIKKLKNEVGNLKAEYRTIHSKYRNRRLQSSIARLVKKIGIVQNETPPLKIEIEANGSQ